MDNIKRFLSSYSNVIRIGFALILNLYSWALLSAIGLRGWWSFSLSLLVSAAVCGYKEYREMKKEVRIPELDFILAYLVGLSTASLALLIVLL